MPWELVPTATDATRDFTCGMNLLDCGLIYLFINFREGDIFITASTFIGSRPDWSTEISLGISWLSTWYFWLRRKNQRGKSKTYSWEIYSSEMFRL